MNKWEPTPKQAKFLALPLTVLEGFYAGAVMAGKSDVLLAYPLVHKWHELEGFKGVYFRRTFPELQNEIVPRSKKIYPKFGATYNKSEKEWTFPSGAVIRFGHCENEDDVHKYDSMEINYAAFDELTSFTEWQYQYIVKQRVRRTVGSPLPAVARSASNPGNVGHCIPFGEILTPNGWIDIRDAKVGDEVYAVDKFGKMVPTTIQQKHERNYSGPLHIIKNSSLSVYCTPEHSIARKVTTKSNDSFVLTQAQDLPNQCQIRRTANFIGDSLPFQFTLGDLQIRYDLFLRLLGWFISEGCSNERDYKFQIPQMKENYREEIYNLLKECGFPSVSVDAQGFTVYGKQYYEYFSQFGLSREKFIPREILNGNFPEYILDSLMKGDGHWQSKTYGTYYTISKQLANDFCELAVKAGWQVCLRTRQRSNREGLSYEIDINRRDYSEVILNTNSKRCNLSLASYDGVVYDIGIPIHHTFIVRQDGKVWISGNSWVKKYFIDPYPAGNVLIKGKGIKRIYIPATVYDNPYADATYIKQLESLPEAEKQSKLYGKWDAYEGQVFEEFRDKRYPDEPENACHVLDRFEIPSFWPRIVSMDWGYTPPAMTLVLFGAIAPDGRVYIYREMAFQKKKISEWAPEVKEYIDKEEPRKIKLCKSAGQERGQEHTIQSEIEKELDTVVELTSNLAGSRVAGKMLLHEYLRWKPKYSPNMERIPFSSERAEWIFRNRSLSEYNNYIESFSPPDPEVLPKLFIFSTCKNLINAIKSCSYQKTNVNGMRPEDVAEFPGDDAYDACRYLLDECDRFVTTSKSEFLKVQQQQQLMESYEKNQDMTSFYRNARILEKKSVGQLLAVPRYPHGRRVHVQH